MILKNNEKNILSKERLQIEAVIKEKQGLVISKNRLKLKKHPTGNQTLDSYIVIWRNVEILRMLQNKQQKIWKEPALNWI